MSKRRKILRVIFLGGLGVFLLYPFVFCPFRLPYLYCSICPLKCMWGRLRGILLLVILGLNLKRKFYCFRLCPGGIVQDMEYKVKTKKFNLSFGWNRWIKYLLLGLVILFITKSPLLFIIDRWVLYLISVVFLLSFFSHRFWCLTFCPVGALTDVILRISRFFIRRRTDREI